ncbi:hypothetical protein BBJ28_00011918 [Nothophytophthora sp. Chile5]|nr:hypothetical protein BBJ28_00011918 [Nothophytophthora sp. Chile5]
MSTAGDIDAFEHSVEPSVHETLFNSKKWTYIQDSTSNNGAYSGQIQLNLSSISSQASFVNWQEAVIQLPIKMEITNTGAGSITTATNGSATVDQLIPKNGSWNWIDSVSVVIDGTTVQSNQIHQNVAATFSALTEWTLQDERKLGTTSNFSLDSYEAPQTNCPQSLDNLPTANFMSSTVGEYGLANTFTNGGARERSLFTGVKTAANSLAFDIGGSVANAITVAKPVVYAPAVGTFVSGASSVTIDPTGAFSAASGLNFTTAATITIRAGVDGTTTAGTGIGPPQSFTRLLVPTYSPNPTADHALVQKKTFKYFERMTNKFTVQAGAPFTYTLTNGIANPRKIFLQPVITNMTAGSASLPDVINPFRSPFSTVPCTTSPFVSIKNIQLTVGNVPIWNNPVNFGYDMYVQEMMRSSGVDGGLDDSNKAGLLSQRQWESLYRFIPVDIGLCTTDTAMGTINQGATKQKAYDKFYTASFRNDYIQGRKLRALIKQEADDEALTDKLASMQSEQTARLKDYDYEKVGSRFVRAPKKPVKNPVDESVEKARAETAKRQYIHQSTDTKAAPARPRRSSVEIMMEDKGTDAFIQETRIWDGKREHKSNNLDLKRDADNYVNSYQKKQRGKQFKDNRMSKEEKKIAGQRLYEEMLRAREAEADDDTSSDTDSVKREIAHEEKLRKLNPTIRKNINITIDEFKPTDKRGRANNHLGNLYRMMEGKYAQAVDRQKGESYFKDNAPKPNLTNSSANFATYKADMKGWINGIFI